MFRRQFIQAGLVTGGLGLTSLLSSCQTEKTSSDQRNPSSVTADPKNPAAGKYIRYEVSDPRAQNDLQLLAQAVALMKSQPENNANGENGLNWLKQGEVHLRHCPHGTWKFFPWHRDFLMRFEAIVRSLTGDATFSLPYWDWTKNPNIPRAFRDNGSSLYVNEGSRIQDVGSQISQYANASIVNRVLSITDFESFLGSESASGEVEQGPHNGVHAVCGGTMGTMRSPEDPVFWLHHGNVDRLWAEWQLRNPQWLTQDEVNQTFPAWAALKLDGFYEVTGVVASSFRSAIDVLNTNTLQYTYDTTMAILQTSNQNQILNKGAVNSRMPANNKFKYIPKAFTKYGVPLIRTPLEKGTAMKFHLQDVKGTVGKFLDTYLADATHYSSEKYIYRLKVMNFPKMPNRMIMPISFLSPTGSTDYLSHYCVFQDEKSAHHKSGFLPDFNLDFENVLQILYSQNVKAYPDQTLFKFDFIDGATGKRTSATDFDFSKLEMKLVILE